MKTDRKKWKEIFLHEKETKKSVKYNSIFFQAKIKERKFESLLRLRIMLMLKRRRLPKKTNRKKMVMMNLLHLMKNALKTLL